MSTDMVGLHLSPRHSSSPLLGSSLLTAQLTYASVTCGRKKILQGIPGSAEAAASGQLIATTVLSASPTPGQVQSLSKLLHGGTTAPKMTVS